MTKEKRLLLLPKSFKVYTFEFFFTINETVVGHNKISKGGGGGAAFIQSFILTWLRKSRTTHIAKIKDMHLIMIKIWSRRFLWVREVFWFNFFLALGGEGSQFLSSFCFFSTSSHSLYVPWAPSGFWVVNLSICHIFITMHTHPWPWVLAWANFSRPE